MPPAAAGSLTPEADRGPRWPTCSQVNGAKAGDSTARRGCRRARGAAHPAQSRLARAADDAPVAAVASRCRSSSQPNPLDQITPVTDAMLREPPPGDWLLWRRTYNDQGFSPLQARSRARTSADLRVSWAWTLPNGRDETTPLDHDGVLFVASCGDNIQALDAATG
jgi:glucose dehydrogenase